MFFCVHCAHFNKNFNISTLIYFAMVNLWLRIFSIGASIAVLNAARVAASRQRQQTGIRAAEPHHTDTSASEKKSRETIRLFPHSDSSPSAEPRCSRSCRIRLFLFFSIPIFFFSFLFLYFLPDSLQTVKSPHSHPGVPFIWSACSLQPNGELFVKTTKQVTHCRRPVCDIFGLTTLASWGKKLLNVLNLN